MLTMSSVALVSHIPYIDHVDISDYGSSITNTYKAGFSEVLQACMCYTASPDYVLAES